MRFLFKQSCSHFQVIGCGVAAIQFYNGHWMAALVICLVGTAIDTLGEHYFVKRGRPAEKRADA